MKIKEKGVANYISPNKYIASYLSHKFTIKQI